MRFKNLEGKLERESPKRTISASDGLGSLQLLNLHSFSTFLFPMIVTKIVKEGIYGFLLC